MNCCGPDSPPTSSPTLLPTQPSAASLPSRRRLARACALLLAGGLLATGLARAQSEDAPPPRPFPPNALRGTIAFVQPPEILLNGQPARLAPGARIRGADNMLRLPMQVTGASALVHYTRDLLGQPLEIWVLTAAEADRKPWPKNDAELQSWQFDGAAQRWIKP